MTAPRYVLVRRPGLSLDQMATRCGLHPDMVRRLVALGLLPCRPDAMASLGSTRPRSPSSPGSSGYELVWV